MKKLIVRTTGIVSTAALAVFLSAQSAFAQAGGTGGAVVNQVSPLAPKTGISVSQIIAQLINVVLWAAGVLAVIYLIWGGIMYITAGGDAEKASKGRVAITNAIIGILIIVAALAIFNAAVKIPTQGVGGLQ